MLAVRCTAYGCLLLEMHDDCYLRGGIIRYIHFPEEISLSFSSLARNQTPICVFICHPASPTDMLEQRSVYIETGGALM